METNPGDAYRLRNAILTKARERISDAAHWTHGTIACTDEGRAVAWDDACAARWCLLGAIYRAAFDLMSDRKQSIKVGLEIGDSLCRPGKAWIALPGINDRQGHIAAVRLLERAVRE
jgi:hypothetical protein